MVEDPDKIVTLKIRNESREWLKDEQNRLRKSEGREAGHAELFDRMRAACNLHVPSASPSATGINTKSDIQEQNPLLNSSESKVFHEQLERILQGGQPIAIEALRTNLMAFDLLTNLTRAPDGGQGNSDLGKKGPDLLQAVVELHTATEAVGHRAEEVKRSGSALGSRKTKHQDKAHSRSGD